MVILLWLGLAACAAAALWGALREFEVHYEIVQLICPEEMSVAHVELAGDPTTGLWQRVCHCDLEPPGGCERLCLHLLNDGTPIELPDRPTRETIKICRNARSP